MAITVEGDWNDWGCPHKCCRYAHGPELGHKDAPYICWSCHFADYFWKEYDEKLQEEIDAMRRTYKKPS